MIHSICTAREMLQRLAQLVLPACTGASGKAEKIAGCAPHVLLKFSKETARKMLLTPHNGFLNLS